MWLVVSMNRMARAGAVLVMLALLPVGAVVGQIPDGPYFGQAPPGMTPEIFAADIVSFSNRREDRIAFSADGQQCAVGVGFSTEYTRQEGGHWLPWDSTPFGSFAREPYFSPDGTRLFLVNASRIFVSDFDLGVWSTPVGLPAPVNVIGAGQWVPMTTSDGTLYFASSRDGSGGWAPTDLGIYRAALVGGVYPVVERLGSEIHGTYGAADPFVAPDGSYMVFGSDRPQGSGDMDFYLTFSRGDGSWSEPRNLGPVVNSPAIEFGPFVSPDGNYFFFSRPAGFESPSDPADILWVDSLVLFEPQACCLPNNSCQILDPRVCADGGGEPGGVGTMCLGDGNGDGADDFCVLLCEVDPPLMEPAPETAEKNRFLSLVATNPGMQTALRVTLSDLPGAYAIWNGGTLWVTEPRDVTEQSGSDAAEPAPAFQAAFLSCEQDCRDWGAVGALDVYGEAIVPGAQYHVQAIECGCDPLDEASYSAPLPVAASRYGDVVGQFDGAACSWTPSNGVVGIPFDTVSDMDKFRNAACAPRKARADIVGVPPNQRCIDFKITVADYVATLDAFRGLAYPFSPSAADPCDALPCPGL